MSRPSLRRSPLLESLENRQVLSSVGGPSDLKQFALEMINLTRTNPSRAADLLTSHITPDVQATLHKYGLSAAGLKSKFQAATPLPPVAYSDALEATAQQQGHDEILQRLQTHSGANGSNLSDRIASAGYANLTTAGENTYAYADTVDEAMQSFAFDWGVADQGHFKNLLQPGTSREASYKDVGIGLENTPAGQKDVNGNVMGPLVITQDFGTQKDEGPQVLGVVFQDSSHSGFYAPGEGQAGVTIHALNLTTGRDYSTPSWNSGGYQIPVAPDAYYKVTATRSGQVLKSEQIYVGKVNEKADFILDSSATAAPTPPPAAPNPPPAATNPPPVAPTPPPAAPTPRPAQDHRDNAPTVNNAPSNGSQTEQDPTQRPVDGMNSSDVASRAPTAPTSSPAKQNWIATWSRYDAVNKTETGDRA